MTRVYPEFTVLCSSERKELSQYVSVFGSPAINLWLVPKPIIDWRCVLVDDGPNQKWFLKDFATGQQQWWYQTIGGWILVTCQNCVNTALTDLGIKRFRNLFHGTRLNNLHSTEHASGVCCLAYRFGRTTWKSAEQLRFWHQRIHWSLHHFRTTSFLISPLRKSSHPVYAVWYSHHFTFPASRKFSSKLFWLTRSLVPA